MKKMIAVCVALMTMMMVFAGCSAAPQVDEVQTDLYSFVTEGIQPIQTEQAAIITKFNDAQTQFATDAEGLKNAIDTDVVPAYQATIDKVNALTPATDEVKDLQTKYIEASNKQLEAFQKMSDAAASGDSIALAAANQLASDAKVAMTEYEASMKSLAVAHGIAVSNDDAETTEADTEAQE